MTNNSILYVTVALVLLASGIYLHFFRLPSIGGMNQYTEVSCQSQEVKSIEKHGSNPTRQMREAKEKYLSEDFKPNKSHCNFKIMIKRRDLGIKTCQKRFKKNLTDQIKDTVHVLCNTPRTPQDTELNISAIFYDENGTRIADDSILTQKP
jgi:hypothetical protein